MGYAEAAAATYFRWYGNEASSVITMLTIEELFRHAGVFAKVLEDDDWQPEGLRRALSDWGRRPVPASVVDRISRTWASSTENNHLWILRRPGQRPVAIYSTKISNSAILLLVLDFSGNAAPKRTTLQALFEFTPAEAMVAAAMVEGLSVSEIASAKRCSAETVRQHLKSIYMKTCTRRQSELVAVLAKCRVLPGIGKRKRLSREALFVHLDQP